ncbi:MAG: glycosyltransferase family 4 protein [Microscillaceae bacterium]|nr:glycosyltransferase family 4 protein [Microscillaceae bacterium]MDW8461415.1 glycosyltransferase family 4 protein [Cytophagales bacterium]
MVKLLWITENYPPQQGGMAQSADRIVQNLRRRGLIIDVLHLSEKHKQIEKQEQFNGQYISFPLQEDLAHSLQLLWLFVENQLPSYDYLVAFGGYVPIFVCPILSRWLNVPLVTLLRGNDFDVAIFTPKRFEILERCLLTSQKVACVSSDKIRKIKALYPQVPTFFTPNGIDIHNWQPLEIDKKKAQELRNTWQGKKAIGLFGQLKAKKGLQFFINSLLHSGVASQVHLLVVGELEPATYEKLHTTESPFSFTYFPLTDRYQLLPYYLAVDAVALPSFYDGMPNVLLEAGALGIPLIASLVAGMADVLSPQMAFLFPPLDFDACRKAIYDFVKTEPSQLASMGKALQTHIQQNFSHEQEAERYWQLFTQPTYFA